MDVFVMIVGLIYGCFSIYIGFAQHSLWSRGVYNSNQRFSYKRIKSAIAVAKDQEQVNELNKAKRIYTVYLILFYSWTIMIFTFVAKSWSHR